MVSARWASLAMLGTAAFANVFTGELPDYSDRGENWGDTVEGAGLCKKGTEQSPIDLFTDATKMGDKMELNGYGYESFTTTSDKF